MEDWCKLTSEQKFLALISYQNFLSMARLGCASHAGGPLLTLSGSYNRVLL